MNKLFNSMANDVRATLAYFWSIISAVFIFYVAVKFGDKTEILTLLIGFVSGGIMAAIMGVYFNSSMNKKDPQQNNL